MNIRGAAAVTMAALESLAGLTPALGASNDVVIGDIGDLSGVYTDIEGAGGVEAIKMAIADFGGTVLGRNIVTLVADHQNKPNIGASKFREWADQKGLNVLIAGSNTAVAIAMAKIAAEKKVVYIVIGAVGASLTNEDCTPYSIHYVIDTTALANGTATAMVERRQNLVLPDRRLRVRNAVAEHRFQSGRSEGRQESGGGARADLDRRLFLLPAAGAGIRGPGAGTCECRS